MKRTPKPPAPAPFEPWYRCLVPTCPTGGEPQYCRVAPAEPDLLYERWHAPKVRAQLHWITEHEHQTDAERGWDRPGDLLGVPVGAGIRPLWTAKITED